MTTEIHVRPYENPSGNPLMRWEAEVWENGQPQTGTKEYSMTKGGAVRLSRRNWKRRQRAFSHDHDDVFPL